MNSALLLRSFVARLLGLLVFVLCGSLALAQEPDPPGRVGRLNHAEGTVTFSPAGDNEWIEAQPNRPLTRGDRLWTDRGSRAEIQIGASALRLDGQTHLEILALDDRSAQLSLTQGTVYVRVRNLPDGENFEIDTPNLAYRAAYPGDYRIDVNATDGTTRVTIHSGAGVVYGEGGHSLPMGGGQQISFRARALSQVAAQESPPQDAFDRWASERNRREDQSISARHVPREVVGYQQLDAHGQWKREPAHGAVWYPQGTPADWAPYRHGHWEWIGPWGWTWIDDAPWGFAPFHYGRWTMIESRWAWVPGRLGPRPVYAPALVAFVGNKGGGALTSAPGRSGVAWFPLAPGEMWQPAFRSSVGYISNVNRHMVPGSSDATYAYQRRPEALTFISGEDFHRGRPTAASWWRIAADTLTSAGIVPPPPMPARTAVAARDKKAPQRTAPAPQPDLRQVASGGTASPPGDSTPRNGSAAQATANTSDALQRAEQAKAAQQARTEQAQAEKAKVAEQAKAAQQAKLEQTRADKARLAEQARVAEQAKLAEQSRRTEQAEQARQAALERSRVAQQAKAAAKAQEQQRKLAEQARQASRVQEAAARADAARREQQAKRTAAGKQPTSVARTDPSRRNTPQVTQRDRREAVATRAELARNRQAARRELQAKRAELARRQAAAKREGLLQAREARRAEQMRREAEAKRDEEHQRIARAQQVEQARRIAERDAQALHEQRAQREEQARRLAEREYARREREYAEREAWQRQQQAIAEQWRREAWEQQQRERARSRPEPRDDYRGRPPDVWQRGIPILNPGRTS